MPGYESFRAFRADPARASFWPREAPRGSRRSPLSEMWDGMTARERAFWLRSHGAADAVARGAHEGQWGDLPQSTQAAILEGMAKVAQRARVLLAGAPH